jgi:hypothetical protein
MTAEERALLVAIAHSLWWIMRRDPDLQAGIRPLLRAMAPLDADVRKLLDATIPPYPKEY